MQGIKWSEEEIQYLRDNYGVIDLSLISTHLHRSFYALRAAAKRYGIKSQNLTRRPIYQPQHICWRCVHATNKPIGYCSWADRLEPIDGWETKDASTTRSKEDMFAVISCPLFEEDPPRPIFEEEEEI